MGCILVVPFCSICTSVVEPDHVLQESFRKSHPTSGYRLLVRVCAQLLKYLNLNSISLAREVIRGG
jgi:hypothetical protein